MNEVLNAMYQNQTIRFFVYSNEVAGIIVCMVFLLGTTIAPGVLSSYYDMPASLFADSSQ